MKSAVLFSVLFVGLAIAVVEGQMPTPEPLQTPGTSTILPPTTESTNPTTPEPIENLPLAEECDEELCKLPNCRCSTTDIPGGLSPRDTPQFVTITFDDGVNIRNIETYREVLYNRNNSDGCPVGATFYVSHEYTNYRLVNELYNRGFEVALHSITHRTPQSYWATATYNVIKEEIAEQMTQMSHFANIPFESIKGVRLPFLQLSGNSSFQVMADYGLEYDSTWTTIDYLNPGLWPYTLDYASTQDCQTPPCPTASIPKPWVQPMVSWTDLQGLPCAMVDACFYIPDVKDEEAWYRFIVRNFERHYLGNRAPFGFYVHEWFLYANPAVKSAFMRFMNLISTLSDAYMVNTIEVINWMKNPVSVPKYRAQGCKKWSTATCSEHVCGPLESEHNELTYWMEACTVCPRVYPWVGNPFGI